MRFLFILYNSNKSVFFCFGIWIFLSFCAMNYVRDECEGTGWPEGYESELLEVFRRCNPSGDGLLDSEGVTRLCQMLRLDDTTSALLDKLSLDKENRVSFPCFKTALLSLLSSKQFDRTNSPEREVSPKYVYGQKKYGRRSRPESTDYDNIPPSPNILDPTTNSSDCSNPADVINGSANVSRHYIERDYETVEITNGVTSPEPSSPEKEIERSCSELRLVWERMGNDGYLNKSQLARVCSSVGMDTLADQVVNQVFSKLGRDPSGRVSFEEFIGLVRAWSPPSSPPPIPLSAPPSIYHAKYNKVQSNSEMWDSQGISSSRLLLELQSARNLLESLTEERDKLKTDLADANQRASLLAQEVDERHARIEKTCLNKVRQLEAKHSEELKEMEKRFSLEKEQLHGANQKLEATIAKHLDKINKLTSEIARLKEDFEGLEKENLNMRDKLSQNEAIKIELENQLKCFETLHQRMVEMESCEEREERLKEKVTVLMSENTELRDRNDELSTKIEEASCRPSHRREGSWGWGECVAGSGGTKRRGKSPEWREAGRQPDPACYHRLGKVRRCSTENDLYIATSAIPCYQSGSLKKSENSESGLETDVDTVTGSSPTLSNGSLENVEGYGHDRDQVKKLRAYICELEQQLNRYHIHKDWDDCKLPLSDDESYHFPSIVALKSEHPELLCGKMVCERRPRDTEECGTQTEPCEMEGKGPGPDLLSDRKGPGPDLLGECPAPSFTCPSPSVGPVSSGPLSNFNDGIDWDSSQRIPSPPGIPAPPSMPSSQPHPQFHPSQPVSQLNFKIHNPDLTSESHDFSTYNCASLKGSFNSEMENLRSENRLLNERCKEYENSLELMRIEYEKTEDYWADKLDEERKLYEEEQIQSDEKFVELEAKIQEYAELFANENSKKQTLPTIEEKDILEKQFTDLEEEFENYKLTSEEEMARKDLEILSLQQSLTDLSHCKGLRDFSVQTDRSAPEQSNEDSSDSESDEESSDPEEFCKCHQKLTIRIKRKKNLKSRLVVECQALENLKRQILDQIAALRASTQMHSHLSNVHMWNALTSKLRYQESMCEALENSLKQQQKRTKQALHEAYERHKFDLMSARNTLKITREQLKKQSAITTQQLKRLAEADMVVKDLFVENAQLVAEIASLKFSPSSERIGPISL